MQSLVIQGGFGSCHPNGPAIPAMPALQCQGFVKLLRQKRPGPLVLGHGCRQLRGAFSGLQHLCDRALQLWRQLARQCHEPKPDSASDHISCSSATRRKVYYSVNPNTGFLAHCSASFLRREWLQPCRLRETLKTGVSLHWPIDTRTRPSENPLTLYCV